MDTDQQSRGEAARLGAVVFTRPQTVLAWAEQNWSKAAKQTPAGFDRMGVSAEDMHALYDWLQTRPKDGKGWVTHVGAIARHARAQLAREAGLPTEPARPSLRVGQSVWIVTPDGSVTPSFVGSLDGDLAVFATIPRPCCGHVSEAHETEEAAWLHLARKSRLFAAHYTREAESVAMPGVTPAVPR